MNEKTFTYNKKKYTVKEVPLGQYQELFKRINAIGQELGGDIEQYTDKSLYEAIPALAESHWDELLGLVEFGSGIKQETLAKDFGLSGLIKTIEAIFEVNDIQMLKKYLAPLVQKVTGLGRSSTSSPKATPGTPKQSSNKSPEAKQ